MRIYRVLVPAFLMLAACGDPLAGVERVSDGAVVPEQDAATALPNEEELARETPILAGLFRKRAEPKDVVAQVPPSDEAEAVLNDAPDGPDAGVDADRVADPDAIVIEASAIEPEQEPKGVFGWLRRAAAAQAVSAPVDAPVDMSATGTDEAEDLDFDDGTNPTDEAPLAPEDIADIAPVTVTPEAQTDLVEPAKRKRLFGRAAPVASAGMALRDVDMGAALPFGEIGRVCDARARDLGTLVDQAARKGPGYYLYDSAPDATGPRTFYVTGFSDRCARQFTASLAIFGAPEFHEQLRYGLPAKEYPYSTTDQAYEKVKKQVCNVGRNKPCGPRISRLENTTVFISVYEHFGENARWADMLLHDGALLAAAVKTP